jgi:glucosamine 6-phosphate synthetase-like amidotransferase/phosphosugar isomerase protein
MCGLFGIVDYKRTISDKDKKVIFRTLAMLNEKRGTDAAGVCILKDDVKIIHKCDGAGRLLHVSQMDGAQVLLGHTRAGTIGGKTEKQAHPFNYMGYVLTHNGTAYTGHNEHKWAQGPSGVDSETMLRYLVATGGTTLDNIKEFNTEWNRTNANYALAIITDKNEFVSFRNNNPFSYVKTKTGALIYSSDKDHLSMVLQLFNGVLDLELDGDITTYDSSKVLRINKEAQLSFEDSGPTEPRSYRDNWSSRGNWYSSKSSYTNLAGEVREVPSEKVLEGIYDTRDWYGGD